MHHPGRHEVKRTRPQFHPRPAAGEGRGPGDHGVSLVRAVPMFAHVYCARRADHELRRMRCRVTMENVISGESVPNQVKFCPT